MFQYLILGVVLLIVVALLSRWFATSTPSNMARWLKWLFFGIGGAATIFLAVTGKMQLAIIPLALTLLPRILGGLMRSGALAGGPPSAGRKSQIETDYLRMSLDHDTGDMTGTVRRGQFAERVLATLSRAELMALLDECRAHDPESARLLESYLDRTLGPEWREAETETPGAEERARGRSGARRSVSMSREEAFEILGLSPDASQAQIKEAHRSLMLKLHPDQGGSNYLATKINEAKDRLLGG